MRIALDTNRYRDLTDGDQAVVATIETADDVFVPFVVLAELRGGFAVGRHGRENERHLLRFLAKPGVGVLFGTDATTHVYADLYGQLRRQGTPVPTHDLWIAALVVEHSLVLMSRDRHFDRLPQIHRI
ncbi:type II toxin-antitoxin system VapC family toxin [Gaiella sp.]|uniref:type II toxin-antitoxin system VapC family toxin n=1 Tax=Gaiella sp. TaxID=2663207 RepID=UPI002E2FF536|nr:type II toxin-antitoxin system VapC family toxin [Gaiella sp.]HEX5583402.1 type II toxin-antitoxin system VapC family toxin [Gaiella sp.]